MRLANCCSLWGRDPPPELEPRDTQTTQLCPGHNTSLIWGEWILTGWDWSLSQKFSKKNTLAPSPENKWTFYLLQGGHVTGLVCLFVSRTARRVMDGSAWTFLPQVSPWESIQIWIQEFLERFSPLQGRTKLDIWFYSFMKKNTYQTDTGNYCLKVLKTILHSNLGPDVLRNPGIQ